MDYFGSGPTNPTTNDSIDAPTLSPGKGVNRVLRMEKVCGLSKFEASKDSLQSLNKMYLLSETGR